MNYTIHLENGERVYPCRCGETHRGDYAAYDYGHHNCLHEAELHNLSALDNSVPEGAVIYTTGDVMCPQCGKTWMVKRS